MTEPRLFQRSDLTFHADTVLMVGAVVAAVLGILSSTFGTWLNMNSMTPIASKGLISLYSLSYSLLQCLAIFAVGAGLRIAATALLVFTTDEALSKILGPSRTERAKKRANKLASDRDAFYNSIEPE